MTAPTELIRPADGSGAMFDQIAHRYDLLNRVMSFGIDRGWRRRTIKALELSGSARVLDIATGTGDFALDLLRRNRQVEVVGIDPSRGMLEVARQKAQNQGVAKRFQIEVGVGEQLPFADDSFDGVAICFGIRNVPDRPAALREMARVVRPGRRIAVLELSEPRGIARLYVHHILPRIGAWLSGSREYRYLQKSIAAFPPASEFARVMTEAGIAQVTPYRLTFGVCHLYVGRAP